MNCSRCFHFTEVPRGEEAPVAGVCRRYPPVPVQVRANGPPTEEHPSGLETFQWQSLWPSVLGESLCGEFRSRDEKEHN